MMKRLLILCCLVTFGFSLLYGQEVLNQKVDLQVQNKPFPEVLYELIDKQGVKLSFRNELLPQGQFSFSFVQLPLRTVLDEILDGTQLTYRVLGSQILLVPAPREISKQYYTLSGFISDAETGESLIGANIYDLYSQRGTVSNEYGFFSLKLPGGPVQVQFSYLGYENHDTALDLDENKLYKIALNGSITLSEVVVYPRDTSASPIGGLATGQFIGLRETQLLPSLAGEPDVIRTAFLLPGVTSGTDGTEGLQIRGGDGGQNLVLLDGVPVYYVNHSIGLFSIFNTNAIRSAQLFRAGFPARYGGRLSSVLDIRMKEGNLQSLSGTAETGLLTSRFTVEGPIWAGKSSFLLSGRWSFVHLFLKEESRKFKQARGRDGNTDYRFYDLNAKFNYAFSEKDRVFLSLYRGHDNYDDLTTSSNLITLIDDDGMLEANIFDKSFEEGLNWGNTVGSLRWNHVFSTQLFANFSITYSRLDQQSFYNSKELWIREAPDRRDSTLLNGLFRSGIEDIGLKADWQYYAKPKQEFRFGLGMSRRIFKPGALIVGEPFSSTDAFANNSINTSEITAYVEGQGSWGTDWEWNAGLHTALWYARSTVYPSLQPRISVNYLPFGKWRFSASVSRMVQNLHFLRNTTVNLPTEIWVPSTELIRPAEALMGNLGFRYQLSPDWELQGDIYYKKMNRILAFEEGVEGFKDWEENVVSGQGRAYGVEWQLRKVKGTLTGWLSYTWSLSERQFEDLNLGETYPFRYDRPHNLQIVGTYQISPSLYFSATWGYASGFAFTLPLIKYTSVVAGEFIPSEGAPFVLDPDSKNANRMPPYHRLDVNFHYEWQKGKFLKHRLNVGVYNLYNQNNPLYYDIRSFQVNQQNRLSTKYDFVEVQLTPILPTISYQLRF